MDVREDLLEERDDTIVYEPPLDMVPALVLNHARFPSFGKLPEEIWSCGILLFCELQTLLRLNWTSVGLRRVLNNPQYVQLWQRHAWFLKASGCECARGVFYLNVQRFPDFVHDCKGLQSLRDMEVALRSVGRSAEMYADPMRNVHRLPYVDPNRQPSCFTRGLLGCWVAYLLIPMPRILPCPVEDAHDTSRIPMNWRTSFRMPYEEDETYRKRTYWGCHHEVKPEDDIESDTDTIIVTEEDNRDQDAVLSGVSVDTPSTLHPPHLLTDNEDRRLYFPDAEIVTGFGDTPSLDLVRDWKHRCEANGADYLDPAQDDGVAHGMQAVRWARRLLYESPLGIQMYPHALCFRKKQLCGKAYRSGTDYIEHLYLPARRGTTSPSAYHADECRLMLHHGLAYFHPVRYENEAGDFCNWALSMLTVMLSVQQYLWYDCVNYAIRRIVECSAELATEVQVDMSPRRLTERWASLQRACFFNQATWPMISAYATPEHKRRQQEQNAKALDLIFHHSFVDYNRHIARYVDAIQHGRDIPSVRGYLLSLVAEPARVYAGQRSEASLYGELHDAVRTLVYVTSFAVSVGPLTDPLTERRRLDHMSAWINCAASLLMFAPGWDRPYSWEPSATGTFVSGRVPHIVLERNHRFQELLLFLNRRTLYYHPEPEIYQYWQNRNLEVGRPLNPFR